MRPTLTISWGESYSLYALTHVHGVLQVEL
jgi:hypothetical protein